MLNKKQLKGKRVYSGSTSEVKPFTGGWQGHRSVRWLDTLYTQSGTELYAGVQLVSSFLFNPGSQPVKWHQGHLGWVFPSESV